jgi:hypothetical protein
MGIVQLSLIVEVVIIKSMITSLVSESICSFVIYQLLLYNTYHLYNKRDHFNLIYFLNYSYQRMNFNTEPCVRFILVKKQIFF